MGSIPFYAKRFVAGVTDTEALQTATSLNTQNISCSLDLLGENITTADEAIAAKSCYFELLEKMTSQKISGHISIKLTLLGLDLGESFCHQQLFPLLERADALNRRVALDMEGSAYTERTLATYEAAAARYRSPEAVLQASLKRTETDLKRVLGAGGRLRLCKGAYKESATDAHKDMGMIRNQYKKFLDLLLKEAHFVAIATHDDVLIEHAQNRIAQWNIPAERYEFQMLYGLRRQTWHKLAANHGMCVYLPYGVHWQAYFARRLAERKENVLFILKNFFRS